MANLYPYAIDYSNRQVDMELLQSVPEPKELLRVTLGLSSDTPKIVTGVQKMAQRYALLFLSTIGDIQFDPNQGGVMLAQVGGGRIQNQGQLQIAFAETNSSILGQIKADNANDLYGVIPDDELIVDAQLLDFDIDFSKSTVYLRIRLITRAGSDIVFIVPVTATRY